MAGMLYRINSFIPVGVVSYNAAYRKKNMPLPVFDEMKKAHSILKRAGLKNVFARTSEGFIQPSGAFLPARGPF